jgi:hypothetical protein
LIEANDGKEKESRMFLARALEIKSSSALDQRSQKLVKEIEKVLK